MKIYYRNLIFLFTFLFYNSVQSQEGLPIYTDYLTENYYLLHPSMAGVNLEGIKLRMTSEKIGSISQTHLIYKPFQLTLD